MNTSPPQVGISRAIRERRALLAARALIDRMRAMYRELEQLTGAPIAAHRALQVVGSEPGISASKLAHDIGMKKATLSHVLKNLVERGWIERRRDTTDQRSIRILATAAGRKILQATNGRAVGTLQRAVAQLTDDQLAGMAAGLETILTYVPDSSPGPASEASAKRSAKKNRTP